MVNIFLDMKTFSANKTYLQVEDPELSTKLATYLENTRHSQEEEDDDDGNDENGDNTDSDDE